MSQPNVLLIMTDQQKATSLPTYGNPDTRTPSLDGLADRGTRYDLAFTPHPLCVPARVSLWTGSYPHDHGVRTNELRMPDGRDNFLRLFDRAGYRLALFGKDHCFGWADAGRFEERIEFLHRGRVDAGDARDEAFRDWITTPGLFSHLWDAQPTPLPAEYCPAARIAEETCRFLNDADDRPFLAWVSFPEPHEPYYAPSPFAAWYSPESISLPPQGTDPMANGPVRRRLYRDLCHFTQVDEHELRTAVATYYAMVSFVDSCVGKILETLEKTGLDRHTIVIFTSDHGDFAGEHGLVVKCNALFDCLTRVPLIVALPGPGSQEASVDDPVSLIDVMPTVAKLAGLDVLPASRGRILPGLGLPTTPRPAVFAEYGAGAPVMDESDLPRAAHAGSASPRPALRAAEAEGRPKMIRTRRWKYVYDPLDTVDELYDLDADPWELVNLADGSSHADVVAEMRRSLLDWSIRTEDAEPIPLYFDENAFEPRAVSHLPSFED